MPLTINLRHLERGVVRLRDEVPTKELDLAPMDELIEPGESLLCDLRAERLGHNILVQGRLEMDLKCQCARCLKVFPSPVCLEDWILNLDMEGEGAAAVENDCVDLTPYVREDILLAFPQHPLCNPECRGLLDAQKSFAANKPEESGRNASAWEVLNKLKF